MTSRMVGFLRGMNLGNRRITNDELRRHIEDAGFHGVATYRASGNVIFDDPGRPPSAVESAIEGHLADVLGYEVDTYVRELAGLREIVNRSDVAEAEAGGRKVYVTFLKEPARSDVSAALSELEGPADGFEVVDDTVLWFRDGGVSDAPFGTRELEAAMGPRQTRRTVGTVRNIVEKFAPE